MAIIINTNISASVAQAAMTRNGRDADTAVERLSSGNKINSAADDAAGLAIANRMTAQIRGLGVAIQNAHDALNMVSTADGAASEMSDLQKCPIFSSGRGSWRCKLLTAPQMLRIVHI